MTHSSYFFQATLHFAEGIAQWQHKRGWSLSRTGLFTGLLGLLSPAPLLLFCLYVLQDTALNHLETLYGKKSPYNRIVPFPPVTLFFIWFELVFFEVMYRIMGVSLVRYINVFALCCIITSLFLIYGYLKINRLPLNIHRLVERLENLGDANEKDAPLNYITLTFKILKKDLLAIALIALGVINVYLLYLFVALGSIFILGFTLYSLFMLNVLSRKTS